VGRKSVLFLQRWRGDILKALSWGLRYLKSFYKKGKEEWSRKITYLLRGVSVIQGTVSFFFPSLVGT
jgi:hypothetical protein